MTREELAQRIGCTANTLYKIEADQRRPSKQMAELFAEHLHIPSEERPAFIRFARSQLTEDEMDWETPFHPPTNLPVQPTVLIGRDDAVATLHKRLLQPESHLLTLTGPPGIGKTQLALAVAAQVLDDFPDGVFFVALAPIADANQMMPTIAGVLGLSDTGPQTPLERLKVFLRDKQMLLLLDNFEQLLAGTVQIAELLAACPWVKLLVTSRAPLRIRQERQIPVLPLALPDLAHLADIETVTSYAAVTFFLERAQAVKPDFSITPDNAPAIAALCARLDGLPLAIELISARVKLLPPAALLERLSGRLLLQSDGLRDLEPRHRTLNAAIDWSYQLLSADEQMLFRRLGIFVGGWTLDAAEAVCLDTLSVNILDGIASLLDKNLIKQATGVDGEPRFTMLETIREYALESLVVSGELELLQRQHAAYFLMLAETPDSMRTEGQMKNWWDRLELEHANFRAALTWSFTETNGETGLRLALALALFWRFHGHMSAARDWFTRLLMRQDTETPSSRTSHTHRAWALDMLGEFCMFQGDLDAAELPLRESLALFRELQDTAGVAELLSGFGLLFERRGDYERASGFYQESLTLFREIGASHSVMLCLFFLGVLAHIQSNLQQAHLFLEESLLLLRASEDSVALASVLSALAGVELEQENYLQAHVNLLESLTRLQKIDERWQIVTVLEVCACVVAAEGQRSEDSNTHLLRSVRLFGATEALHKFLSVETNVLIRRLYEKAISLLRAQLDETTMAVAWAEGRAMTLEQAVAYALAEGGIGTARNE